MLAEMGKEVSGCFATASGVVDVRYLLLPLFLLLLLFTYIGSGDTDAPRRPSLYVAVDLFACVALVNLVVGRWWPSPLPCAINSPLHLFSPLELHSFAIELQRMAKTVIRAINSLHKRRNAEFMSFVVFPPLCSSFPGTGGFRENAGGLSHRGRVPRSVGKGAVPTRRPRGQLCSSVRRRRLMTGG